MAQSRHDERTKTKRCRRCRRKFRAYPDYHRSRRLFCRYCHMLLYGSTLEAV